MKSRKKWAFIHLQEQEYIGKGGLKNNGGLVDKASDKA